MHTVMGSVKGVLAIVLITINTIVVCVPLLVVCPIQLISPEKLRKFWDRTLDHWVIDGWVGTNRNIINLLSLTKVSITWHGDQDISRQQWYLVISNHQSWTDILVLQTSLYERIPPVKFFTKRQLIWIPFVGVAMWLLGFPYVRRVSRAEALRTAHRGTKSDRQATLDACKRFRDHPTSVLNFLEGTRFTPEKHARQRAGFKHLLNPKVGGLSYVMDGLNDHLHKLVDITVVYPEGAPTFWQFMQGQCPEVTLRIDCREIPSDLLNAGDERTQRKLLGSWIDGLWREKDQRIAQARAA
jgi:1-acyl-sn-glycerol-3-phosphate acyltransferase